jgi:hypothetical protein
MGRLEPVRSGNDHNGVDAVAWARRVNSRWIAHHGLSEDAGAYLAHLDRNDPDRLARSCRRAYRLVRHCAPAEDPKPWFYAALFSLATEPEVRQFLRNHWFTRATNPEWAAERDSMPGPGQVGGGTQDKLSRVRQALRDLAEN